MIDTVRQLIDTHGNLRVPSLALPCPHTRRRSLCGWTHAICRDPGYARIGRDLRRGISGAHAARSELRLDQFDCRLPRRIALAHFAPARSRLARAVFASTEPKDRTDRHHGVNPGVSREASAQRSDRRRAGANGHPCEWQLTRADPAAANPSHDHGAPPPNRASCKPCFAPNIQLRSIANFPEPTTER